MKKLMPVEKKVEQKGKSAKPPTAGGRFHVGIPFCLSPVPTTF